MNKTNDDWRGSFGSIRVPFEYKSILIGMVAVGLFLAGVFGIDLVAQNFKPDKEGKETDEAYMGRLSKERQFEETIFERFLTNQLPPKSKESLAIAGEDTLRPDTGNLSFEGPLAFWFSFRTAPCAEKLGVLLWWLVLWALLGGAVTRITAMRVAKDESISFKEAFQYVWNNKLSYLLTPIAVMVFMAVFVLCNMLAGVVSWIPFAGPILFILLYVLVLLSTLFLILLGIGLFFGMDMISSSISTEGGDGLQAVINVFNYVYARPWQYILYTTLIVVSTVFIWWVGGLFVDLSLETTFADSDAKQYEYVYEKKEDKEPFQVRVIPESDDPKTYWLVESKLQDARKEWLAAVEKLEKEIDDAKKDFDEHKKDWPAERVEEKEKQIQSMDEDLDKLQEDAPEMFDADMSLVGDYISGTPVLPGKEDERKRSFELQDIRSTPIQIAAAVLFFIVGALKLLVLGYAASYVLAGFTTLYFILRRDVDGTDFEEIVEKEDSVEFGEEVFEEKKPAEAKPEEKKPEPPKPPEAGQKPPEGDMKA